MKTFRSLIPTKVEVDNPLDIKKNLIKLKCFTSKYKHIYRYKDVFRLQITRSG